MEKEILPRPIKKYLIITIDVEAGPHLQSASHVDRLIWGRFGEHHLGIGRMMEIAERLGQRLSFFVDYCETLQYPGEFERISNHIIDHGHDLQLHAHTQFLTDAFWTERGLTPARTGLERYDNAHANVLMECLVHWAMTLGGGHRPVAFRGGAFRYNRSILEAMMRQQLSLSFNYNIKTPYQVNNKHNLGLFRWSNGVIEVPMGYVDIRGRIREFEFSSTSATDFGDQSLVREYMDTYYAQFGESSVLVMLMHSWSFLYRQMKGQGGFFYEYKDHQLEANFQNFLSNLLGDVKVITASDLHLLTTGGRIRVGAGRDVSSVDA
jgi:hypothetical protein